MDAWGKLSILQVTDRIIIAGNEEGAAVYRLVRDLTVGRLRQAGVRIDFDGKPDSVVLGCLRPGADRQMLARFYELERTGTKRAATAIVACWQASNRADAGSAINRLLEQQLNELDQADARRSLFVELHGGVH